MKRTTKQLSSFILKRIELSNDQLPKTNNLNMDSKRNTNNCIDSRGDDEMKTQERRAIMLQHRQRHIEQLQRLGYIYSNMNAIKMLETKANNWAVDACNGDIDDTEYEHREIFVKSEVKRLFGCKLPHGFFYNGDPRGYSLKLDDKAYGVVHPNELPISYRDWGGYMILAPEKY